MKKVQFLLAFSLISILSFAQRPVGGAPQGSGGGMPKGMTLTGRAYGKIVDATTKKPIEFASVVALRPLGKRDSIVGGGLTLENGDFNIDGLPLGGIKIKVSFIGYKDFVKMLTLFPPETIEIDMGDIQLAPDTKVLSEVEVTAQKSQMQLQLDKKVFNVDKNITAQGGTAEDVLKNVPSVTVDADGSAKLRNNSTMIYVDGRPTLMSINQIPADQIESVEVISNPSAKFEAATAGGIINIVLKKNKKPGYNGFISAGIGTGDRYNGTVNLNVKEGRMNWTGFYSGNFTKNPTEGYTNRTLLNGNTTTGYFDQNTLTTFDNNFQIGRLGLEYMVNNRNTISLAALRVSGVFDINADQDYSLTNANRQELGKGTRTIRPQNSFENWGVQGNWRKTYPKKGKELVADAMFNWGGSSNAAIWQTSGVTNNILFNQRDSIDGGNIGNQFTFTLDYTNPLNDSTKIEMGVRAFYNQREQDYLFNTYDVGQKAYVLNPALSQNADIVEMVNAAYITYSSRFKNKINYQLGLRFEQSELDGKSKLDNQNFGFSYPKSADEIFNALFPSAFFSKKLSKSQEIQANFSRKINRPNFMQLMPVIQNNDLLNVRRGNQALKPEFINLAELNYNKLWGSNNWLLSLYGRMEEDPIVWIARQEGNVTVTQPENGTVAYRYGLDNTLKLGLAKDLELTTNVNIFNLDVRTVDFEQKGWAYNLKGNLNWKLPKKLKDFSMQLNGSYESDQVIPQGERKGIYFFDYALKYTFFRVGSVTFQVNDITNTRREILVVNQPTFVQESMRRRDLRFYRITFQMPFGKMDASIFRRAKEGQRNRDNNQNQMPDFGG
jgi:hypothetical protein